MGDVCWLNVVDDGLLMLLCGRCDWAGVLVGWLIDVVVGRCGREGVFGA